MEPSHQDTLKKNNTFFSSGKIFFVSVILFLIAQIFIIQGTPNNLFSLGTLLGALLGPFILGLIITIPVYYFNKKKESFSTYFFRVTSITFIFILIFSIIGSYSS